MRLCAGWPRVGRAQLPPRNLAEPGNPLSAVLAQVDSTVINGTRIYRSAYDGTTRTATTTSPEGRQSSAVLDAQGRVTQTQVPGITATSYSYDGDGRLAGVTQGTRSTGFTYGSDGLLVSVTDPLWRTSQFFYDAAGRVTRQILPDGREIAYTYDAAGNLTSLTPPSRPAHGSRTRPST